MAPLMREQSGLDCAPIALTYLMACLNYGPQVASRLTYDDSLIQKVRRLHSMVMEAKEWNDDLNIRLYFDHRNFLI